MSGVFGLAAARSEEDLERCFALMQQRLRLRPWYSIATVTADPAVRLGRVGIDGESAAPLHHSEDGRITIAFAGRLWDTTALRRQVEGAGLPLRDASAEELVLRLYQAGGRAALMRLNGELALCLWDEDRGELLLVSDPLGMRPTYWAHADGRLIFAATLHAVLAGLRQQAQLDRVALAQYVRFQNLLGDRTFFEGVTQLTPGSVLRYRPSEDRVTLERHWSPAMLPATPTPLSAGDAAEQFLEHLDTAVRRRTRARNALFLTGGLDSRLLLAVLRRRGTAVEAATYGAADSRDVVYARRVARAAGVPHRWFPLIDGHWVAASAELHLATTEALHPWLHGHGASTLPALRQSADVLFTGWGGGTVVGGWLNPFALSPVVVDNLDLLTSSLFHWFAKLLTWPGLSEGEERLIHRSGAGPTLGAIAYDSLRDEIAPFMACRAELRTELFHVFNHDFRMLQPWSTMLASHLEVGSPYFDFDLFRTVYSAPLGVRGYRDLMRGLLQRLAPRLNLVPYDRDGALPTTWPGVRAAHLIWGGVARRINRLLPPLFPQYRALAVDYETWLRGDLRAWGEELLLGERTLARGVFVADGVRALWKRMQAGDTPDFIGKLAPLMSYELMLRHLVDT